MGVISKFGSSIAEISQKELVSNFEEGWAKFPIYLYSEGDEQRTKLIAAVNAFVFLFDGRSNSILYKPLINTD